NARTSLKADDARDGFGAGAVEGDDGEDGGSATAKLGRGGGRGQRLARARGFFLLRPREAILHRQGERVEERAGFVFAVPHALDHQRLTAILLEKLPAIAGPAEIGRASCRERVMEQ